MQPSSLSVVELCAGAGGMALGIDRAGFRPLALVENDPWCCRTLRAIPRWRKAVREVSLREWRATTLLGSVDLLAGGIPCPPFSRAGHNRGGEDERDLFPDAIRIVDECRPRAVFFENVKGLASSVHRDYLVEQVLSPLKQLGYYPYFTVLDAAEFGVPQRRERTVIYAIRDDHNLAWSWPSGDAPTVTVGQALKREVGKHGWPGTNDWAAQADDVAPTLVGGSKKHGGPDLGPTQARAAWLKMRVDGRALADGSMGGTAAPGGIIRLTVPMCATLQGFPNKHPFQGGKTAQYRQVGNAFPPPVAEAIARRIHERLTPP